MSTKARFNRVILFALLCVVSCGGAVVYALHSFERSRLREAANAHSYSADTGKISDVRRKPHLLFRNTALGSAYGRLSLVSLDAVAGTRYTTDVECERVYGTNGVGLCLQASRGVFTTYRAVSIDENCDVTRTFELNGAPSRTRVSKNGRMAATTVFVRGDSYNSGGFSTRTNLIDLSTGKIIGNLEEFTVTKEGQPFKSADFNFWGVTFSPNGQLFYATLASAGVMYLVEGRSAERQLRVVRTGIECPSLSPEGYRVAYKARTSQGGRLVWRLHVLNLQTGEETIINESRTVDDQAEWLDSNHLLYALPRDVAGSATSDIWIARADGTGTPSVFLPDAFSPCVIRP